jgi:biopolymer transport protein TolR
MAFSPAGGGLSRPEMNVTPLIDVLLVLIIMFMVVVSMAKEQGVEAQLPQPAPDPAKQPPPVDGTVVVQVLWSSQSQPPVLRINHETVTWDQLEPRLREIFKMRADKVAFVKGEDDLDFEYVAQVIALARNAGVDRVGLLTKALDQ